MPNSHYMYGVINEIYILGIIMKKNLLTVALGVTLSMSSAFASNERALVSFEEPTISRALVTCETPKNLALTTEDALVNKLASVPYDPDFAAEQLKQNQEGWGSDLSPLLSLNEALLANVLEFVGTKASSNVCQTFHRLLRGTPEVRGIGHFRIEDERNFSQENLRSFENVHSLSLTHLPLVDNVSALGRVQHLELAHLPLVDNVSALGNVNTLTLYNLPGVTDVSALGNVNTLTLWVLPGVTDVSALGNVKALFIRASTDKFLNPCKNLNNPTLT